MGFKDMVEQDIHKVFLNPEELAEPRTVIYDGEQYEDIPIILSGLDEKERNKETQSDHAQGLYSANAVMSCALSDLGGKQPEQRSRIKINDAEGGGGYFTEYYVVRSQCEFGVLKVELEAIEE